MGLTVVQKSKVVHEVFRHLLCEEGGIDFDSMGPNGFGCLWRYFSVVNMEAKALSGSTANKVRQRTYVKGVCFWCGRLPGRAPRFGDVSKALLAW